MADNHRFIVEGGVLSRVIFDTESKKGEVDLVIPDNVKVIADGAFYGCKYLRSVKVSDSVTEIGRNAFAKNRYLESFSTGNGITSLGNIFSSCYSLVCIHIGSSVEKIDENALSMFINSLAEITVDKRNRHFVAIEGVLYSKDKKKLIKYPSSKADEFYKVPRGVTTICANAFHRTFSLKGIELPQSLDFIESNAFCGSGIVELVIPEGVRVGTGAFSSCTSLAGVTLSNNVTLGEEAFADSGVEILYVGKNVDIGAKAFSPCRKLRTVSYAPDVKEALIGDYAFSSCPLLDTIILPTMAKIGVGAFRYCAALVSFKIESGELGDEAYANCSKLEKLQIGRGVLKIGHSIVRNCMSLTELTIDASNPNYEMKNGAIYTCDGALLVAVIPRLVERQVKIPEGTVYINSFAFYECAELESIILPDTLRVIGAFAFADTNLISFYIPASVEEIGEDAFYSTFELFRFEVSEDNPTFELVSGALINRKEQTLVRLPQDSNTSELIVPEGIKRIEKNALCGCVKLRTLSLPESLEEICENGVYHCTSLREVTLGGVRVIGKCAFCDCERLGSITLSDRVERIENMAFMCCSALRDVTIGRGLKEIPEHAFQSCTSLSEITIPDNITRLDSAFFRCAGLKKVKIGKGVCEIPKRCFAECKALTELEMGSNVAKIGRESFYNTALAEVHIPASVEEIGFDAFGRKGQAQGTKLIFDNPSSWVKEDCYGNSESLDNTTEVEFVALEDNPVRFYRLDS